MLRRFFSCLGPTALALAALLLLTDTAGAQMFRGRGGSGFYVGPGGFGYGNYPGTYGGAGYAPFYGNYGYSPYYGGYYGRGYYSSPWYYDSDYTYGDNRWVDNRWTDNRVWSDNYVYGADDYLYGAHYGCGGRHHAFGPQRARDAVVLELIVPPNAELWLNGERTTQRGAVRSFVTPPLTDNQEYAYEVRMRWLENGRTVDKTRRVNFKRGDLLVVDMSRPQDAGYMYGSTDDREANRQDANRRGSAALIDVMLPSNAEVWINNEKTKQTGGIRSFVTPALDPDRDTTFTLKAKWQAGDRTVEETRHIALRSGERIMLDLMAAGPRDLENRNRLPEGRSTDTREDRQTPRSEEVPRPKEKE